MNHKKLITTKKRFKIGLQIRFQSFEEEWCKQKYGLNIFRQYELNTFGKYKANTFV